MRSSAPVAKGQSLKIVLLVEHVSTNLSLVTFCLAPEPRKSRLNQPGEMGPIYLKVARSRIAKRVSKGPRSIFKNR